MRTLSEPRTTLKNPWLETLVIRRAIADDRAFFAELLSELRNLGSERGHAALEETRNLPCEQDLSQDFTSGDALSVVATDGRNLRMGAAWASTHWQDAVADSKIAEVRLAVRPEFRGRGVGGALLLALLSAVGRQGIHQVSIIAQTGDPALGLYERAGFQLLSEHAGRVTLVANLEALSELSNAASKPSSTK